MDDLLRWHQILARKGWVAREEAGEFVRLANSLSAELGNLSATGTAGHSPTSHVYLRQGAV